MGKVKKIKLNNCGKPQDSLANRRVLIKKMYVVCTFVHLLVFSSMGNVEQVKISSQFGVCQYHWNGNKIVRTQIRFQSALNVNIDTGYVVQMKISL